MRHITLHSEASAEMNAAAAFYESRAQGLGHAFLDEIQRVFEQLVKMPEAGAPTDDCLRRKTLRRFPHTIIYTLQENRIRVLAVAHQKRYPGYWLQRQQDIPGEQ